jgi:hypothetical protein
VIDRAARPVLTTGSAATRHEGLSHEDHVTLLCRLATHDRHGTFD